MTFYDSTLRLQYFIIIIITGTSYLIYLFRHPEYVSHESLVFVQPVNETPDTMFLKLDESIYSRENFELRFILRLFVFTDVTLITAASYSFYGRLHQLIRILYTFPLNLHLSQNDFSLGKHPYN
ncbi:hypothetical protein V2J09_017022 [Rumex salicifolius]